MGGIGHLVITLYEQDFHPRDLQKPALQGENGEMIQKKEEEEKRKEKRKEKKK